MTHLDRILEACMYIHHCVQRGQPAALKYKYRSQTGTDTICSLCFPDGKVIVSKTGSGYDKIGAAFSEIVELLNLPALEQAMQSQTYQGIAVNNGVARINGAASFSIAEQAMRLMGYKVEKTRKITKSGNVHGEIVITM